MLGRFALRRRFSLHPCPETDRTPEPMSAAAAWMCLPVMDVA